MDWIDFKNQTPEKGTLIWGKQPSGTTVLGTYEFLSDDHRVYIKEGNYYLKIIKWTTYDVIY